MARSPPPRVGAWASALLSGSPKAPATSCSARMRPQETSDAAAAARTTRHRTTRAGPIGVPTRDAHDALGIGPLDLDENGNVHRRERILQTGRDAGGDRRRSAARSRSPSGVPFQQSSWRTTSSPSAVCCTSSLDHVGADVLRPAERGDGVRLRRGGIRGAQRPASPTMIAPDARGSARRTRSRPVRRPGRPSRSRGRGSG